MTEQKLFSKILVMGQNVATKEKTSKLGNVQMQGIRKVMAGWMMRLDLSSKLISSLF